MTITHRQLTDAAFWEIERICLDCGSVDEVGIGPCEECGGTTIISPLLAIAVLSLVTGENDETEE